MADGFLEKQYDDWSQRRKVTVRRSVTSLDTLLHKNRSHRGFDPAVEVTMELLRTLVGVCPLLPSGHNAQVLRYRCVTASESDAVLPHIRLGGSLPELHLPLPGEEPRAFIVACSTVPPSPTVWMDLGIACEAMGLKAVEIGLNALIIRAFDAAAVRAALHLPLDPVAILAIGKGTDRIFLKPVSLIPSSLDGSTSESAAGSSERSLCHSERSEGISSSLAYYRKDGVHFVPKLTLEDILL